MINIYQLLYSMEQLNNLACPIGLCNNEIIQGGTTTKLRTNEERDIHSIDSSFFDMLFNKAYDPIRPTNFVNKTRKNRS